MIYSCHRLWTQYMLGSEERWPLNGSLDYYIICQLEVFCRRAGKRYEIPYVECSIHLLNQVETKSGGCHLMVQWFERKPKGEPVLQGEEGENESGDMLFQNLTPLPAYPAPPLVEQAVPAVVPTAPSMPPTCSLLSLPPVSSKHGDQIEVSMLTPRAQGPDLVSPSKTQEDTKFGLGVTSTAGQFPLC